ncbi:hypothetical protein NUM3379_14650 [Kineococcus sp. NUM-3379]
MAAPGPLPVAGPAMHPLLTDLRGAAELTATPRSTVRRWAFDGRVPGTRVGGQWRFWAPALLSSVAGPDAAEVLLRGEPVPEPGVVGTRQLAELLGLPRRTVALLLREGKLPGRKAGHEWRVSWPAVRDRIAAGRPLTPDGGARPQPGQPA